MSLSASELYEAGLGLPPAARKDVALRLLESVEVADQESVDEAWSAEIRTRVDDVLEGRAETIPHAEVLSRLADRRVSRDAGYWRDRLST